MHMNSVGMFVVALVAAVGCGNTFRATSDDHSERARVTLKTALDAWQLGKTVELPKHNPPIRLSDDDLVAGWQLVDYVLEAPDRQIAPFQDVNVILSLRDRQGRTTRKSAKYQVGLEPHLSVLRSDN